MSCFLSYTSSITGDCSNTNLGAFTINIDGTAPDYTIQWFSPTTGTTFLGAGVTAYTQTNLSAGTYSFNIIDSCISGNTILPVNIFISSGTCVSITNIENTICDANNGSLTVATSNYYGQATFDLYDDITGLISSEILNQNSCVFTNLSYGTYYVIANDGGGCTGKSESVIIKQSSNLSFGLYKVDNAGCGVDSGKLFVTGLTGTPPYTYLWSNGGTGDSITGLTSGTYTVTITDSSNCSTSDTQVINNISQVGLGAIYLTQPTCFTADGEVEIIITGGTAPFYYLGSNGVTNVTFNRSVIFSGLGPGFFSIQVVDAGLCTFTTSTSLLTPKGMSIVNVDLTHSTCNNFSGVIGPIQVIGGTSPYTYSLTDSFGNTNSVTNYQSNWLFDGLPADTYTLSITDAGSCTYTDVYTINNQILFGLTVSTTGTTCSVNDGSVYLEITSGGTPPYIYEINGSRITTTLTSYTFNNLFSGNYTASVTDKSFCKQSQPFTIDSSNTVDFHLLGVDSINNDGSITAYITNGQPPFTIYWSGDTTDVSSQTGMTVTDLLPGNYIVRIVDNNGCSKTKRRPIKGISEYSSTGVYNVCETEKLDQPIMIPTGPRQLLNEAFNELILTSPGYTNCILTASTFQAFVYVGSDSASSVFFTGSTLSDIPSDELWYDTIESLLESLPQIGNVDINPITNTIVVTTNCDSSSLVNASLKVVMRIDLDIACATGCFTPTPTPTPTKTPTPTMTKTPGVSPSTTPTPTPTNLPSEICFYFASEAIGDGSWNCTIGKSGIYNGKPYYSLLSDDCLTPLVLYVWWNNILNRWEVTDTLGVSTIVYCYNNNPSMYPLTNSTYSWIDVELSFLITESILGYCLTPTPTSTMTPTPTPTIKTTYYVYLRCGTEPSLENNVVIQPMPAVPGNVVGEAIVGNGDCWSLINISNNSLSQLENLYPYNSYSNSNYFTQVFGTIYTSTEFDTSCEVCLKYAEAVGLTPNNCNIELRNWSNCAIANTSGVVYVGTTPVYSFDDNFNVDDVTIQIPVLIGDTITIVLNAPINSSCNFAVSDTDINGNIFTYADSINNTGISYSYVTYCGGLKSIEIFSTCTS